MKGEAAEEVGSIQGRFLGRMQKMLRTVTSVERYRSVGIIQEYDLSTDDYAMNAHTALFMAFLLRRKELSMQRNLTSKKGS